MRGKDIRELAAVRASEIGDKAQEQYDRAREVADKTIGAVRNAAEGLKSGTEA
jgi:hypothetical protein